MSTPCSEPSEAGAADDVRPPRRQRRLSGRTESIQGCVSIALLALVLLFLSTLTQASDAPLALKPSESLRKVPGELSTWDRLRTCRDGSNRDQGWLRNLRSTRDEDPRPIFGTPCDVDWHKPIYILPYTYSRDYESDATEVLFGVSAKLRPLGPPLYFAYSQRSYWSLYDGSRSRPFRESVYNPEVFYRWVPQATKGGLIWGLDGGYEHESNGQDIPESRSWDRLYIAPFLERRGTALQLKVWYRLPEDEKDDADDASGDDNPDIEDFYGYSELHLWRRIGRDRRLHGMIRGNFATGHGAIQLDSSWRIGEGDLFWHLYAWHGYGESLQDYNDSVTRVGVGFSLAR
jgi:phospholipase A1